MDTAYVWAKRATCSRLQVGCVIEREGRILVQGYNGAPAGLPHCTHLEWHGRGPVPQWVLTLLDDLKRQEHPAYDNTLDHLERVNPSNPIWSSGGTFGFGTPSGCTRSVHAEQNAIAFAARWGVELEGASLWVTHQPCLSCAQTIINAGIEKVTYAEPYRLDEGIRLLDEAEVDVRRVVAPRDRMDA